jgi:hypothetical protein
MIREKVQLTIGVTGTINVGVMTVGSLVLDVLLISLSPAQARHDLPQWRW